MLILKIEFKNGNTLKKENADIILFRNSININKFITISFKTIKEIIINFKQN